MRELTITAIVTDTDGNIAESQRVRTWDTAIQIATQRARTLCGIGSIVVSGVIVCKIGPDGQVLYGNCRGVGQ